jgi:integrase
VRSATPRRRSGATGSGGWLVAIPTRHAAPRAPPHGGRLARRRQLTDVQRQLGHADIGTTERYYGHLERHVLAAGAVATEEAIARAAVAPRLLRSA